MSLVISPISFVPILPTMAEFGQQYANVLATVKLMECAITQSTKLHPHNTLGAPHSETGFLLEETGLLLDKSLLRQRRDKLDKIMKRAAVEGRRKKNSHYFLSALARDLKVLVADLRKYANSEDNTLMLEKAYGDSLEYARVYAEPSDDCVSFGYASYDTDKTCFYAEPWHSAHQIDASYLQLQEGIAHFMGLHVGPLLSRTMDYLRKRQALIESVSAFDMGFGFAAALLIFANCSEELVPSRGYVTPATERIGEQLKIASYADDAELVQALPI